MTYSEKTGRRQSGEELECNVDVETNSSPMSRWNIADNQRVLYDFHRWADEEHSRCTTCSKNVRSTLCGRSGDLHEVRTIYANAFVCEYIRREVGIAEFDASKWKVHASNRSGPVGLSTLTFSLGESITHQNGVLTAFVPVKPVSNARASRVTFCRDFIS